MNKTYSLHEVNKHNSEKDCWLIVGDLIFDLTKFLDFHPGIIIFHQY